MKINVFCFASYTPLTLCLLGNFHAFLLSVGFCFSKSTFSKNTFRNTSRVSNSLDPEQVRRSRQRVNEIHTYTRDRTEKNVIDIKNANILCSTTFEYRYKVSKGAKIRNRYNQVPHLTQDTKVAIVLFLLANMSSFSKEP